MPSRVYGDIKDALQLINIVAPIPEYLRPHDITVEVTKKGINFRKKTSLKNYIPVPDENGAVESFAMPRNVLLKPETCTIR